MGNAAGGYNKAYLNVVADDIWFDSSSITMVTNPDRIGFWYQGGAESNDKTNIHIGSAISFIAKNNKKDSIPKGTYKEVKSPSANQQFPHMLKNEKETAYSPPVPGSGGSSSVVITQGAEKYY